MIRFRAISPAACCGLVLLIPVIRSSMADDARPLIVGETFTIDSRIVGETRRINVYLPPVDKEGSAPKLPVLYMPDGGISEDFLHIAGLVQVSVGNSTMRPFILVGIENTQRRRDLTGPTESDEDKKIAPHVGGSEAFRKFLREELMPEVRRRYRTTNESAIIGESLAGLFVVETFLREPELFDTYIAVDPSLWWNGEKLIRDAGAPAIDRPKREKTLYLASSGEPEVADACRRLLDAIRKPAHSTLHLHHENLPEEKHATVFHPAALKAFRAVFKPTAVD